MRRTGLRLKKLLRGETVLLISAACAAVSMAAVPPSPAYWNYIDMKVLCLLFSLMLVVAGLRECGLFLVLAQRLLRGERENQFLSLILVLLPFFASMLITNDVALLTFVPFTVFVLELTGRREHLIRLVVLQTVAANLGSMATPVGNPQNLFLYANYGLSASQFFGTVLPVAGFSLLLLASAALMTRREKLQVRFASQETIREPGRLWLYLGLFLVCLLTVFRLLPYWIAAALTAGCCLLFSRKLFRQVDYGLLLTFVCFFVFAGNLGQIGPVKEFLSGAMERRTLLVSALASQVISNVPAAVLLSGFTGDWKGLLLGTNVGGLGTPIASLASLISLKLYLKTENSRPARYLLAFTAVNLFFLAVLLAAAGLVQGRVI